jgi:ketosteroid isomerase-like protein
MTDPKSIVLRFNNCINHADIDGLSELMTEDHVFIDMAHIPIRKKSDFWGNI